MTVETLTMSGLSLDTSAGTARLAIGKWVRLPHGQFRYN
jgi:hypothetical protein